MIKCRIYCINQRSGTLNPMFKRRDIPFKLRQAVIARDGGICYCCGVVTTLGGKPWYKGHLEHLTPVSRGGANTMENLRVACESCNLTKGAKTLDEFREALSDTPSPSGIVNVFGFDFEIRKYGHSAPPMSSSSHTHP